MDLSIEKGDSAKEVSSDSKRDRQGRRARSAGAKMEVRLKLIEAGQDLLTRGAFQRLSLHRIAAHAGYTTGVVYHYFENKEALFHTIRDLEIELLERQAKENAALLSDPEERLRAHVKFLRSYTSRMMHRYGASFLSGAADVPSPDGGLEPYEAQTDPSPASGRMHALADEIVERFFDSLPVHPTEVPLAADSLWGAINSTFTMAGASDHRAWSDPEKIGDAVLDALIMSWKLTANALAEKHK